MAEPVKTSISLPETVLAQAEILAEQLNLSQSDLFEIAIKDFIAKKQKQISRTETRVINQGDIYWLQLDNAEGSEADIPHPHVVIQDNVFNHSRIPTVVACALTSNLKRVNMPGNVLLDVGEANLPKQSLVEVSKVSTLNKAQLGEYIGALSVQRVNQILAGMRFLQSSFLP